MYTVRLSTVVGAIAGLILAVVCNEGAASYFLAPLLLAIMGYLCGLAVACQLGRYAPVVGRVIQRRVTLLPAMQTAEHVVVQFMSDRGSNLPSYAMPLARTTIEDCQIPGSGVMIVTQDEIDPRSRLAKWAMSDGAIRYKLRLPLSYGLQPSNC
jgi:hypothetical protein